MSFIKFLISGNPQMQNMIAPAVEKLKKRMPEDICRLSGAEYRKDDGEISILSLGEEIVLTLPDYEPKTQIEPWRYLTLLQYLNIADGTPLTHRWVALRELPEGDTRGMGFDRELDQIFKTNFNDVSAEYFKELCRRAGGTVTDGKADACAEFMFAPFFPIRVSFWESDEDFPVSGKVLTDANAVHYLSMEGCGTVCVLTLRSVAEQLSK